MARKVETLVIQAEGRDKNKTFILTEMSADKAERWAMRALLALAKADVPIPDGAAQAGMAGVAAAGLKALAKLDYYILEPLLIEMFECVQFKPKTPGAPTQSIIEGDGSQIEEVATRLQLRGAIFTLHTGFSTAGLVPTPPPGPIDRPA